MLLFRPRDLSCLVMLFAVMPVTTAVAEPSANDTIKSRSSSSLDTLVVTSNRREYSRWESAMPVAVVDSEEIRKQNGDSIIETLRDIPGVEISDNSLAGRKQIIIRGEDPSRVLVLIDGQELTYHRSGHGSSAGALIDMESVERIEVVKGPNSVLYGSQAIGGIVNFITRKGAKNQQPFNAHYKSIYNGATDGFTQQGSVYGTVNDFDYRLSGTYSDQDERKTRQGRLKNTDFTNNSASAWLGYRLDEHKLGLSLDHYKLDTNTYYKLDGSSPELKDFSVKIPKLDRDKIGLFYDYDIDNRFVDKIHFDGYYQRLQRQFRNNVLVVPIPTMNIGTKTKTDDTQNSVGLTGQINWKVGPDINLITGAQYEQDHVKQTSLTTNTFDTGKPARDYTSTSLLKNKWQQSTMAIFAQNDWALTNDINWNFGIRQYWIESELKKGRNTKSRIPVSGERSDVTTTDKTRTDRDNHFVVATGLTYQGIKNTLLRASFGQGYVYPTLAHLYGVTSAHSQVLYGNPNLKPEKSNNYEIGLRFNNNLFLIDTALYHSDAKNYITDAYCNGSAICNGSVGSTNQYYLNADKAKTYGAELSIEYIGWEIIPYLNANYMRRKIETASYKTFNSGSPAFSGNLGVKNTTILDAINADLDSHLFVRTAVATTKRSGDKNYHYAGFATLNLSVSASFGHERQYQLGLDLNNLLNKDYTTARETIPAAKFNAVISAGINF